MKLAIGTQNLEIQMEEHVKIFKGDRQPEPDVWLILTPRNTWRYLDKDGHTCRAEYKNGVDALGAYTRDILGLVVKYDYFGEMQPLLDDFDKEFE